MSDIREQTQELFRYVFGNPDIVLRDEMAIADVPGWDSITHINLMVAAEAKFKIKIAMKEISSLKGNGQNIATFLALIGKKLEQTSGVPAR
ncbi:MAG: acyl carrier protein [Elusimicrobiota bacterium]